MAHPHPGLTFQLIMAPIVSKVYILNKKSTPYQNPSINKSVFVINYENL